MKKQLILGLFFVVTVASQLSFAQKGVPYTFVSNSAAVAEEVNENFKSVVDSVKATAIDINANKSSIIANTGKIATLESTVDKLPNSAKQVFTNITAIDSLQKAVNGLPSNATPVLANTKGVADLNDRVTILGGKAASNGAIVSDLAQRVTTVESQQARPDSDYQGFTMPFSSAGEPRNVVVLKRDNFNGRVTYSIRLHYENGDNIPVIIGGVETVFRYHAVSLSVIYRGGVLETIIGWVDGMDDSDYSNYTRMLVEYDPSTLSMRDRKNYSHVYQQIKDTSSGSGQIKNIIREKNIRYHNNPGIITTRKFLFTYLYTLKNGYDANGINFGNALARVEHRPEHEGHSRISVQGIGVVELIPHPASSSPNGSQAYYEKKSPSYKISYYFVNGQTGGNLNDIPLDIDRLCITSC